MDAQHFPFYIILSNYVWSILFYQDEDYNVSCLYKDASL